MIQSHRLEYKRDLTTGSSSVRLSGLRHNFVNTVAAYSVFTFNKIPAFLSAELARTPIVDVRLEAGWRGRGRDSNQWVEIRPLKQHFSKTMTHVHNCTVQKWTLYIMCHLKIYILKTHCYAACKQKSQVAQSFQESSAHSA